MFGGALLGTVILLPYLLILRLVAGRSADCLVDESKNRRDEGESVQFGMQVPFGPMLAGAGLIYFLGFDVYVDAYFAEYISYFFGS
jgi:leader peptidase (prepilin peptidase)/N-methyltransferase